MGSRLTQMLDSESSTGKELLKIYKDLNIAVFDSNGQIRSSFDIWSDLAKVWGTLDKNTQNYISLTSSGANQIQNFSALMKNFSNATKATETAINSTGSAAEENTKYMESLEAKTSAVKETFQDLSTSLLSDDLVGTILDIANGFLQLVDTDVGKIIAIGSALTIATVAAKGLWDTIKIGLIGSLKALNPAVFVTLGILSALVALSPKIKEFFDNLKNPVENATKKLSDYSTQLQANRDRLKEINEMPWTDRTKDILDEKDALQATNAELEYKIALEREELKKSAEKQAKATVSVPTGTTYYSPQLGMNFDSIEEGYKTFKKIYGETSKYVDVLGKTLQKNDETVELSGEKLNQYLTKELEKYNTELKKTGKLSDESQQSYSQLVDIAKKQIDAYELLDGGTNNLDSSQKGLINSYNSLITSQEKAKEKTEEQIKAQEIAANGFAMTKDQAELLIATDNSLSENIGELNGSFYIEKQTLIDLAKNGNKVARQMISDQVSLTQSVISNTQLRIKALQEELAALNNVVQNTTDPNRLAQYEKQYGLKKDTIGRQQSYLESKLSEVKELQNVLNGTDDSLISLVGTGDGNEDKTSSSKSSSDTKKDILESFKKTLSQAEHEIFLLTKQDAEANSEGIIKIYQSMQDSVNAKAQELRRQGYAENSDEIIELQQLWWGYSDKIQDVYDSIEEAHKKMLESIGKELDKSLQTQIDKYKQLADEQSNIQTQAESDAELYKQYASMVVDYIDGQIEGYQKEIDALSEANEEREKQITLEEKINNLAKAKDTQVMVYKDGKFQYVNDIDEISAAQSDLVEYQREQQLEDEKQYWQDKIDNLGKYKTQWENFTDDYQKNADTQKLIQSGLFNTEDLIFGKRITNADSFATKYEAAMKKAQDALAKMLEYEQKMTGVETIQSGIGSSGADWSQVWWDAENAYNNKLLSKDEADAIKNFAHQQKAEEMSGTGSSFNSGTGTWSGSTNTNSSSSSTSSSSGKGATGKNPAIYGRANGTLSDEGGIKLVGEKGPEIRVLNQGDGIIPADVTKNLWSLGTNPYAYLANAYNSLLGDKPSGDTTYKFDINRIELLGVKDAPSFVKGLKNLAYQYSTQRK